jgi:hypothetical protein
MASLNFKKNINNNDLIIQGDALSLDFSKAWLFRISLNYRAYNLLSSTDIMINPFSM